MFGIFRIFKCCCIKFLCILFVSSTVFSADFKVTKWRYGCASAISLTFDDWRSGHAKYAIPILNQYGLPGTFFVVTNSKTYPISNWNELRQATKDGHEIGAHGETHVGINNLATFMREMVPCHNKIQDSIPGYRVHTFCYPYGGGLNLSEPGLVDSVKKYFIAARGGSDYLRNGYPEYSFKPASGSVNIMINSRETFFNNLVSTGGKTAILYHTIENDNDPFEIVTAEQFKIQVEDCRKQQDLRRIWIATFSDLNRYEKERASSSLLFTAKSDSIHALTLKDTMPDSVYNTSLTIQATAVNGAGLKIKQGSKEFSVPVFQGVAYFEVIPDGGEITVTTLNRYTTAIIEPFKITEKFYPQYYDVNCSKIIDLQGRIINNSTQNKIKFFDNVKLIRY